MTKSEMILNAVDDLLLMSNQERKIWMKDAYQNFLEYLAERSAEMLECDRAVTVARFVSNRAREWILTQDGARYLEQYTASLAPMNA